MWIYAVHNDMIWYS
ncbi:Putative uncharacterized protein [Lactococcus lactis subsp. lactis A12]|uniref:Uncharacterized protein n=1 Tax=Lactococcus lactis subsp. lactis A12 TaxID=1137134 RepID=S6F0C9_LACLL|nr:Putative uncharacterized protein [Lactococcus lactis subsp. lactis A12]